MDALTWPAAVNSKELQQRIADAKVLCVGAGGIGCELLKTLVLSGFRNIEVIDLDTIETSNLNRQFLFRKRHVGQSKAAVAAEAVRRFCPAAAIKPHQGNVKDPQYDVDFFKSFDLVLNGLDNMEARRHVNRLTLAAGTPLVESGTEGYLGQVTVHLKGTTECFECQPKAAPKSYPVCTIRNTPDKPIHCVVWAKDLLFARLFGRPDAITDLDEEEAPTVATAVDAAEPPLPDPDAAAVAAQAADDRGTDATAATDQVDERAAAKQAAEDASFFLRRDGESSDAYARRIFRRVFATDIERVLRMKELWKARSKPKPLVLEDLLGPGADAQAAAVDANDAATAEAAPSASAALGLTNPHTQLSLKELAQLFLESVRRYLEHRPSEVGSAVFDKEDDLAVDFVTAAANLRAAAYGITQLSLFDAKGMAGNIVHAVATTNAIISGLIVLEAMKLLAKAPKACRNTFLQQHVSLGRLVQPTEPWPPSKACAVCGTAQLHLTINTSNTTLGAFVDQVLKKRLALVSPTVVTNAFMYEEGAGLDEEEAAESAAHRPTMLDKLPGGGICHGAIVAISDQAQAFEASLVISHREDWDEEKEPEGYLLEGSAPKPSAAADGAGPSADGAGAAAAEPAESDSDEGFEMLDEPAAATAAAAASSSAKRKRGDERAEDADEGGPSKRVALADGLGAVLADPDDDDCIILD